MRMATYEWDLDILRPGSFGTRRSIKKGACRAQAQAPVETSFGACMGAFRGTCQSTALAIPRAPPATSALSRGSTQQAPLLYTLHCSSATRLPPAASTSTTTRDKVMQIRVTSIAAYNPLVRPLTSPGHIS